MTDLKEIYNQKLKSPELKDKPIYTVIEKTFVTWLSERVNAIPDKTWDQYQQRKAIIALIGELTE
jgi:hypothetical protein